MIAIEKGNGAMVQALLIAGSDASAVMTSVSVFFSSLFHMSCLQHRFLNVGWIHSFNAVGHKRS